MKPSTRKLRSPVKWHGGKSYQCRRIIELFPEHETYVEPFFGGGSILLNKPPSRYEIANDLNTGLIQMWRAIQYWNTDFVRLMGATEYGEATWLKAKGSLDSKNGAEAAWAFLVANRMSCGGLGEDFAWTDRPRGKKRPGGPVPGEVNSWETFIADDFPRVRKRIEAVDFLHKDAETIISEHEDDPYALIYCDPPYLHKTRTAKNVYVHEMNDDDHCFLLTRLRRCKAKVFISGYPSSLYEDMLKDWKRHRYKMPNHSGRGKKKQERIECVWESPS